MAKNSKIKSIQAREIMDSRGNPTVEVELGIDLGAFRVSAPSGASKGKYEVKELRDGGKRYQGKGVLKAVKNINEIIAPKLKGRDPTKQKEIDNLMIKLDGTENKSKLGANAILGVSMAVCRAGAAAKNLSLYKYIGEIYRGQTPVKLAEVCSRPAFNIINGGVHAGNELDFQEFMVVPRLKNFQKNLQAGIEIYHTLKEILKKNFGKSAINVGDEGGFAPAIKDPEQALDLIQKAIEEAGYKNRTEIIIDAAASEFYKNNNYQMSIGTFTQKELINYYLKIIKKYPIIGIEDPLAEDDLEAWQELNSKFKIQNSKLLIIGDDLLATNPKRIKMAEEKKACNGTIIKINQIGTVLEAIEAARLAKSYDWKIMVSHRSGETNDDFIADLAVGIGADYIKAGAPARGERVAKYNRLLKIEQEIYG